MKKQKKNNPRNYIHYNLMKRFGSNAEGSHKSKVSYTRKIKHKSKVEE